MTDVHRRIGNAGWAALPLVAMAALAAIPANAGLTICPFALATGTACPGCGLTRAGASLMRGDLGGALAYHPLVLVVGLWLVAGWMFGMARRRGFNIELSTRLVNGLLTATAAVFLVTWAVRAAAGDLPPV